MNTQRVLLLSRLVLPFFLSFASDEDTHFCFGALSIMKLDEALVLSQRLSHAVCIVFKLLIRLQHLFICVLQLRLEQKVT